MANDANLRPHLRAWQEKYQAVLNKVNLLQVGVDKTKDSGGGSANDKEGSGGSGCDGDGGGSGYGGGNDNDGNDNDKQNDDNDHVGGDDANGDRGRGAGTLDSSLFCEPGADGVCPPARDSRKGETCGTCLAPKTSRYAKRLIEHYKIGALSLIE